MKILLCVVLLSPIVPDRQFFLIQESWIYQHTSRPSSLNDVMSAWLATLVRDLGCEHYSCRENATELLLQKSNECSVRALFWGSHHTDQEIANRCRVTLSLSLVCNHCNGYGVCHERTSEYNGCNACFAAWKSRERMDGSESSWYLRTMYY